MVDDHVCRRRQTVHGLDADSGGGGYSKESGRGRTKEAAAAWTETAAAAATATAAAAEKKEKTKKVAAKESAGEGRAGDEGEEGAGRKAMAATVKA